jgi:hypothetical protein
VRSHDSAPHTILVNARLASPMEVWQRFAGKWATGDTGQKPCAIEAQPLLILKGFLTSLLEWLKTLVYGRPSTAPTHYEKSKPWRGVVYLNPTDNPAT